MVLWPLPLIMYSYVLMCGILILIGLSLSLRSGLSVSPPTDWAVPLDELPVGVAVPVTVSQWPTHTAHSTRLHMSQYSVTTLSTFDNALRRPQQVQVDSSLLAVEYTPK